MSNNTTLASADKKAEKAGMTNIHKPLPTSTAVRLLQLVFKIGSHISPKLSGYLAYRLWLSPPRFKTPEYEQQIQQSADIEYHEINNKKIATYQWGQSGPIILLIHGWSGRGTQLGAFIEPLITSGFRVLSFDAPAHGKSAGKQTNIYEIADTILALNNIYGPFESVITHSFGGPCLAIAMKKGLNTSRVINISPPAATEGLVNKFAVALSIPQKVKSELIRYIEKDFGKTVWQDSSMENNVAELDIPALVIHDVNDVDVPWHEGQKIAQAWSKVRFIKTSNLGHRRILRDPCTIEATTDFIKGAAIT